MLEKILFTLMSPTSIDHWLLVLLKYVSYERISEDIILCNNWSPLKGEKKTPQVLIVPQIHCSFYCPFCNPTQDGEGQKIPLQVLSCTFSKS